MLGAFPSKASNTKRCGYDNMAPMERRTFLKTLVAAPMAMGVQSTAIKFQHKDHLEHVSNTQRRISISAFAGARELYIP